MYFGLLKCSQDRSIRKFVCVCVDVVRARGGALERVKISF